MTRRNNLPLAVVIGLGTNGLAVTRALAERGVPVIVLCGSNDVATPYFQTRYGIKRVLQAIDGPTVIATLASLNERTIVFPTLEHIVGWLSENRHLLPQQCHIPLPSKDVVRVLLNKAAFERFALAQNLAIPTSRIVGNEENISTGQRHELRLPVIVKPAHKLTQTSLPKAVIAETNDAMQAAIETYQGAGTHCIVQEFIPGEDSNVVFCMQYITREGELKASFTGRKIRQWRPLSGGTASCEPVDLPELHELTKMIFDKVGFFGIGSMEYKIDQRDGSIYCIEPTAGRTDFQEGVAICNGVNIPYIAYANMAGIPVESALKTGGTKAWMHFTNDRLAAQEMIRAGKLTKGEWLKSLGMVRSFDFFSIRDPGPMFYFAKKALQNRLGI